MKKNTPVKLSLTRKTVMSLSAQKAVNGGIEVIPVSEVKACSPLTMTPPQCCPACRSGANATVAKEFCVSILDTIDNA